VRHEVNIFWSEEDGCYVARIPQLPFTGAHGVSYEEALANAREALEVTLSVLRETGKPIPTGHQKDPQRTRLLATSFP
jgi:predicted RNase H-like HicB family nuclease